MRDMWNLKRGNNFLGEVELVYKFFKKYPEVRYMPLMGPIKYEAGGTMRITHPASHFVHKQKKYMKQGYDEKKAFELAERDLEETIQ